MTYYPEHIHHFVVRIDNAQYFAALEVGKIYPVLPDADAESLHMVRVIDESGEDYLYAAHAFLPIDVPPSIQQALQRAA